MTILDQIIKDKLIEVENRKSKVDLQELKDAPYFDRKSISMKDRLLSSTSGIIAEFKRKSPSKGWIHEDANVQQITTGYSLAGASGISILTDTPYFGGSQFDLASARPGIKCAVLRKDFMVDSFQLYEAKAIGADVILLIAAALSPQQTCELAEEAHHLGLEVLLEVHNEEELGHANEFVDMLGVNNRNLKTFEVDMQLSYRLAKLIPDQFVKVSESGISSPDTVKELREVGYKGFLMGENFMKEADPSLALSQFIRQLS